MGQKTEPRTVPTPDLCLRASDVDLWASRAPGTLVDRIPVACSGLLFPSSGRNMGKRVIASGFGHHDRVPVAYSELHFELPRHAFLL